MDSRKPQVEELQALQESLEMQRRQVLALILGQQDTSAPLEETENPRLKLALINQELAQCTAQLKNQKRSQCMGFSSEEKMRTIAEVLQKNVPPAVKEAERVRDEAEVKVQILVARAAQFEGQKVELAKESDQLKQEISRVLHEGGDPSEINHQVRAKAQESEDLVTWAAQLRNSAIPAAEKALSDAKTELWNALLDSVNKVRPDFSGLLSDLLAQASEIADSWHSVVLDLFKHYRTGRPPSETAASLTVDRKRTTFSGLLR